MKKYILLLFSLTCISACSNQKTPSGVVAVVNGSYITLNELRNRYDVQTMHMSEYTAPPIDSFHREYTETLLEMIVELAVEQELLKYDIAVSDVDVNKAVQEIQGGYSDEEFHQMLAERYIDFESWKKQIRAGVVENLYLKLLSSNVSVSREEIEKLYKNNPSLFIVDYKIYGDVLSSRNKDVVLQAIAALEKGTPRDKVAVAYDNLSMESIVADSSNIPMEHIDEVIKIAPRKATTLHDVEGIYSAVYVANRIRQVKLSLEEAWNMAQNYIIDNKVRSMYQVAVEGILKNSSIQVVDEFRNEIDGMLGISSANAVHGVIEKI